MSHCGEAESCFCCGFPVVSLALPQFRRHPTGTSPEFRQMEHLKKGDSHNSAFPHEPRPTRTNAEPESRRGACVASSSLVYIYIYIYMCCYIHIYIYIYVICVNHKRLGRGSCALLNGRCDRHGSGDINAMMVNGHKSGNISNLV